MEMTPEAVEAFKSGIELGFVCLLPAAVAWGFRCMADLLRGA